MPDLDARIAQWRKSMIAHGATSPQAVDELESHLRDEVARLLALDEAQAFDDAVTRLGDVSTLKSEFAKLGEPITIPPARHRLFSRTAAATAAMMLLAFLGYPYGETFAILALYPEIATPVFAVSMIGYAAIIGLSLWGAVRAHALGGPKGRIVAAWLTLSSPLLLAQWFILSLRTPLHTPSATAIGLIGFIAGSAVLLALILLPASKTESLEFSA
jgi:hypothetical protein